MIETTARAAATLEEVVIQEFSWIDALIANGLDEYQIAFLIKSVIVRTPHYQNDIPVIVSDLKDCIKIQYLSTAA